MSADKSRYNSFPIKYKRLTHALECPVEVHAYKRSRKTSAIALIDTGSTHSVISKALADVIQPQLVGYSKVMGLTGGDYLQQFIVDIVLPNSIAVRKLQVSESMDLGRTSNGGVPIGALIGMDILQLGDLAVSHYGGLSAFSFRMPSIMQTDYVEEYDRLFPSSEDLNSI